MDLSPKYFHLCELQHVDRFQQNRRLTLSRSFSAESIVHDATFMQRTLR